ncbi:MAG: phosphatidylglycerol lysyltransferase domain-containing protein [Deltaproteobacteria bacterium]|nr:phosphatidylglycerol lysyltransferase domain-containing protein [Deltaproteobacteria bacterium]
MTAKYPDFSGISLDMRSEIEPLLKGLKTGISEFTFANIYLFRATHSYRIARLGSGRRLIAGEDRGKGFFMLPWGIEEASVMDALFKEFSFMKNATEAEAMELEGMGYKTSGDRDNYDYVYLRDELAGLHGRRFHRMKNLVNGFSLKYRCETRPLLKDNAKDALLALEEWRRESGIEGDFEAAKEAVALADELVLCGFVYYIEGSPVGFTLGEELSPGTFAVHFEKALARYKGLAQAVNQSFAAMLPERYRYINREQDLGDPGLRQAKESYHPSMFIKKYRVGSRESL